MQRTIKYFILLTLTAACLAEAVPRDFTGYKVFRLKPKTDEQIAALKKLEDIYHEIQFWTGIGKTFPVDIMVPPHLQYEVEKYVTSKNIKSTIWIGDVQQRIGVRKPKRLDNPEDFNWDDYSHLDDINTWMSYLVERYKPFVTLVKAGRTYENRTINALRISFNKNNKFVFLEAGIHPNEWIAPATATFIIHEVLTNTDPNVRAVVEKRNWIIVPSMNPDGYAYTFDVDRTWRKNRKPTGICTGIDLNRNFPYQWMEGGADIDSCFPHYAGSKATSEIESRSFVNYFEKIAPTVEIYISFHSYLQVILIPYAHNDREVPPNNDALHHISNIAARALYGEHTTRVLVGNSASILYVGSGTSTDWVQKTYNQTIKYCATIELRDDGHYGYLLPPDQIIATGEENFDAVVSIVKQLTIS